VSNVLHELLIPYVEDILLDYQYSFRKEWTKADHFFALRLAMEKTYV
jgi:hypothetical protein